MYLCYRNRWSTLGRHSNHKPMSLPVSTLGRHLHSLPLHIWASMRLTLLWGASDMVTRRGLDIGLDVQTNKLVLVLLLLLVVRFRYQSLPLPSWQQSLSLYSNKFRGWLRHTTSTSSPTSRVWYQASNCRRCRRLCHYSRDHFQGSLMMRRMMVMMVGRLI